MARRSTADARHSRAPSGAQGCPASCHGLFARWFIVRPPTLRARPSFASLPPHRAERDPRELAPGHLRGTGPAPCGTPRPPGAAASTRQERGVRTGTPAASRCRYADRPRAMTTTKVKTTQEAALGLWLEWGICPTTLTFVGGGPCSESAMCSKACPALRSTCNALLGASDYAGELCNPAPARPVEPPFSTIPFKLELLSQAVDCVKLAECLTTRADRIDDRAI